MNITNPFVFGVANLIGASHMIYTLFYGLFTHSHYASHSHEIISGIENKD